MMSRLQAEEQLRAIGAGVLAGARKEDRTEAVRALQERARGAKPERAKRANESDLASMGIGVRTMPVSGITSGGASDG